MSRGPRWRLARNKDLCTKLRRLLGSSSVLAGFWSSLGAKNIRAFFVNFHMILKSSFSLSDATYTLLFVCLAFRSNWKGVVLPRISCLKPTRSFSQQTLDSDPPLHDVCWRGQLVHEQGRVAKILEAAPNPHQQGNTKFANLRRYNQSRTVTQTWKTTLIYWKPEASHI